MSNLLSSIQIPLMRSVYPQLITNQIVGVQPMSGPVGLAFALRYKYNDPHGVHIKRYEPNRYKLPDDLSRYAVVGVETTYGEIKIIKSPDKGLIGKVMIEDIFNETFFEEAL